MKMRNKLLCGALASLLIVTTSCNIGIGLGGAVDTAVPVVAVTYPPEASVVRGSFVVAGTCTDDRKVTEVEVRIRKSDTGDVIKTLAAKVDGEKWSVTVNSQLSDGSYELLDGQYTVDAIAKDASKHSSSAASATYDVDNTAPCLIISKPLAVADETPSVFGQTIKIAGDISEEHSTTSLTFHLQEWDSVNKQLIEGTQKDIAVSDFSTMTSDAPLIIAKYYTQAQIEAEAEESKRNSLIALRNKYLEIYGSTEDGELDQSGDKIFYASVQLTDNAKEYKNPGDSGVESGNVSQVYWINSSDFYDNLMKEDAYNLTASKLRKLINGTSTDYSEDTKEIILEELKKYSISSAKEDLSDKSSVFLVNPDNNPFYNINEYEYGKENNANIVSAQEATNGYRNFFINSPLTISVEAGRDAVNVDPATISVTVYRMENASDKDLSSKTSENEKAWTILKAGDWTGVESTTLGTTVKIVNSADTGTYTDEFFCAGEFYRVVVEGSDIDGNEILAKCSAGYGFQIYSNSNPPIISIVSAQDEYISGDELNKTGKVINFTVTTAGTTVAPTVTLTKDDDPDLLTENIRIYKNSEDLTEGITVTNVSTNEQYVLPATIKTITAGAHDANYVYNVSLTLGGKGVNVPVDDDENEIPGKYRYNFVISVNDSAYKTSLAPFTFYINNDYPKIQNVKVSPVESDNKVNGVITFKANASTNYELASIEYKIYVGTSSTPVATGITDSTHSDFGSLTSPEATFDTASDSAYDKKSLKIAIIAKDKVNNELTYEITGYTIDQSSDIPVLSLQNVNAELEKTDISETNGNVFDKNGKIVGSFTDTDGLADVTYTIKNESGTTVSSASLTKTSGALFNIPVPKTSAAGYYKVILTAQDSTYSKGTSGASGTKQYRTLTKEFWIAVDATVPEISLQSIDSSTDNVYSTQYKATDTIVYAGKVKDDWAIDKIDVYLNNTILDTHPVIASATNSDGSKNWTYSLNMAGKTEGEYTVKFKAYDKAGKSKETSSAINRDSTKPVFGEGASTSDTPKLYITSSLSNGWTNENSVEIRGYVEDATSPIETVEYSIDGENYILLNKSYVVENTVENTKKVIYSGTVIGINNNDEIKIRAKDIAGNIKEISSDALKVDRTAPTISLTHYADKLLADNTTPDYKSNSGTAYINNQRNLYLKGAITDTPNTGSGSSGASAVYFKFKAAPTTASYDFKIEAAAGSTLTEWNTTITTAKIIEYFGSESTSGSLYALIKDVAGNETSLPLATIVYDITYPAASISKIKYFGTEKLITEANKKITFEGSASDKQGISSVYLEYSADKSSWTQYGSPVENSNNWSITVNTEDAVFTGSTYYFRAVAVDSVGNIGNSGKTTPQYETTAIKTITINQDSDIPVVSFSNLTFISGMSSSVPSWLKKTNDMYISVSDDDGVSKIEYTTDTGADPTWNTITTGKITLGDASYTVRFRITDSAGKQFVSGTANAPVLRDDHSVDATTNGILYLNIDKTPPSINGREYLLWDGSAYPAAGSGVSNTTTLKFGGDKNKLKITFNASDSNGVEEVYIRHGKEGETGTKYWYGTCNTESHLDGNEYGWSVELKDSASDTYLASLDSNTYEFTLVVKDTATSTTEKSFNLNVDNTDATLSVDSHLQDELVGNSFILKGVVSDSDTSTKIKYAINGSSTAISNWNDSSLTEYEGSVASWRITVDGATVEDNHTKSLKDLFVEIYGTSKNIMLNAENTIVSKDSSGNATSNKYTTIEYMYFHFLTKDGVGNLSSPVSFRLRVDPQGDLPSATMTYPVATNVAENSITLSGPIRAQGEAEAQGDNSIMGTYMQIDPSYNGTSFNENAWKKTATNNPKNSIVSPSLTDSSSNALKLSEVYKEDGVTLFENVYARYNAQIGLTNDKKKTESNTANNEYGIYVGNKSSWNITINRSGDLNGANKAQNVVAVRLIIVDSVGNLTKTEPLIITLDSDAPIYGSEEFYVYQYAWINKSSGATRYTNKANPAAGATMYTDSGCRTASSETYAAANYTKNFSSAPYSDDMSLKGEWWLSGSVEDDNDIYTIEEVNSKYQIVSNPTPANKTSYTADTAASPRSTIERRYQSDVGNWGFVFNLRVGSTEEDSFEKLTYKILSYEYNAQENKRKSSEKIFTINYDNKAPVVDNSASSVYFDMDTDVANNYGFYTLGTAAYENGANGNTQSGFARAVFYFTKDTKVFDTYLKKGATGNTLTKSSLGDQKFGLYWKTATVEEINAATITIDDEDANIHNGGLVLLGGTYYTITGKSGADITLDKNPSATLVNAPVYFAIGHVVDKEGEETAGTTLITDDEGYGYYSNSSDNKDDFMIESVAKSSTRTIWKGAVNSNNLPDGPAVLHYVVFDAAGNYTENTLDVLVGNNAPRLASVRIWSDFDGNGVENPNGNETKHYYYEERNRKIDGELQLKATDVTSRLVVTGANSTPFMTVKDKVTFVPEIVGGTSNLYYSYKIGNAAAVNVATSFGTGHNDGNLFEAAEDSYLLTDNNDETYVNGHTGYGTDDATEYKFEVPGASLGSNGNTQFQFTIWDSAEGSTLWDSSKCLNATMQVLLNVKYTDSSNPVVNVKRFAYTSASNNNLYKNSAENGHIELEADLNGVTAITGKTVTTAANTTATAMGSDPKVSGKITIRGTAYDDIRLKTLTVNFTGHSVIGSATTAATYTDGTWTYASADTATNMTNNGYTFTVTKDQNTENGHYVEWECNIDTSFIANKAELDRVFTMTAKDARGNNGSGLSSSGSNVGSDESATTTFNRPTYQMDVVPYITKVMTTLSNTDEENPSVYSRTALGHYPVSHITEGFTSNAASWTKESVKVYGFNFDKDNSKDYLTVTPETSAAYEVTKNGIPSLNNYNKNSATGNYNMQPNGVNNNNLTDDVYFDVWQFNRKAAIPKTGKADNLIMKINPNNGVLGFAFSNSSEYFSMPSTTTSYTEWSRSYDYLRNNGLAYDASGNSYGCTVGGDLNSVDNYSDTFDLFIGRWGTATTHGQSYQNSATKGILLDRIGQYGTKTSSDGVYYKNKNRFQSHSFATLRNSDDNGTYLYMAYYDAINNEVRLKAGLFSDSSSASTAFGMFTKGANNITTYSSSSVQLIADGSSNTLGAAGEYVSIGVTSGNTVVLTWFDGIDLYYTYSKTAFATLVTHNGSTNIKSDWAAATKIMSGAGKYCQLVVDNANGVHIAGYDELNSALKYVYIPTATTPGTRKSAIVDAYLDVGEKLTIDVAQISKTVGTETKSYQIPYIGYWGAFNEKPHYAYLVDDVNFYASTNGLDGVETVDGNDFYTGVWECTTVPTPSSPNKNLVSVGVWKYNGTASDNGKLAYSTTGTNRGKSNGTNSYTSSTASTTTGTCYGNGTNNAALAYTVSISGSERWVETAQKK